MEMKQCNKCNGTGKIPGGIGSYMKAKREKFSIKQGDVAVQMGVPVPYLSRLEHDTNIWSRSMMDRYNAALAALKNGAK